MTQSIYLLFMENLKPVSQMWLSVTQWGVELLAPFCVTRDTQIQICLPNLEQEFEPASFTSHSGLQQWVVGFIISCANTFVW